MAEESTNLGKVSLEVEDNFEQVAKNIETLVESIRKLTHVKTYAEGITALAESLRNLGKAIHEAFDDLKDVDKTIDRIAESLQSLNNIKGEGFNKVSNGLVKYKKAIEELDAIQYDRVNYEATFQRLADMSHLMDGMKSDGIDKMTKALTKLPEAIASVDAIDLEFFAEKIKKLTDSLAVLSTLPPAENVVKLIKALAQLDTVVRSLATLDINGFAQDMTNLAEGVRPLTELGAATNFRSLLNALGKLPEVMEGIDTASIANDAKAIADALRPLSEELAKIGKTIDALPKALKDIVTHQNNLNKTVNSGSSLYEKLAKKMNLVYNFRIVKRVWGWVTSLVKESITYIENLNVFNVVLGKYTEEAIGYAETVQNALGIDASEWMRYQALFMQTAQGFGVASQKAYEMSQNLNQVAYDLTSLWDIDIETSMKKVQAGLSGELEPLRRLGFALDQNTLQEIANAEGINQNVTTMTQAQKAILRYIAIMQQSEIAHGDLANTITDPANALRLLEQRFVQLKRAVGNLVIPILMKVVPVLQAVAERLTIIVGRLADLFGITLMKVDSSKWDKLSEWLEEADESAKDLKKQLLGIDKINTLTNANVASAITSGAYDLAIDLSKFDYDFLANYGVSDEEKEKIMKAADAVIAIGGTLIGLSLATNLTKIVTSLGGINTAAAGMGAVGGGVTLGAFSVAATAAISGFIYSATHQEELKQKADELEEEARKLRDEGHYGQGLWAFAREHVTRSLQGWGAIPDTFKNEGFWAGIGAIFKNATTFGRMYDLEEDFEDTFTPLEKDPKDIDSVKIGNIWKTGVGRLRPDPSVTGNRVSSFATIGLRDNTGVLTRTNLANYDYGAKRAGVELVYSVN